MFAQPTAYVIENRVYLLQESGQELSDHFFAIKCNLEVISINFANRLDAEEVRQLEVLIGRFSRDAAIRYVKEV